MSRVAIADRRPDALEIAGAGLLTAAGLGLLLLRPALVSDSTRPLIALSICYAALAAVSTVTPAGIEGSRARLPVGWVLAAGLAAVLAARLLVPAAIPGAVGPAAVRPAAVALTAVAAVAEEAFFRRFLYGWLSLRSEALAVAGSALLFAAVHLPAYGAAALPVDLGAGLLLSWQRWASGDWRTSAATHVFANLLAVIP